MKTKKRSLKNSRVVRVLLSRKSVVFCLIILAIMILASIFAPMVAPYNPYKQDLKNMLKPISVQHILGTDSMGRDLLSRLIYGGRVSFTVGLVSVLIAGSIGMILGLTAGMSGGIIDSVIMRIMDAMMSVPMIIMALFLGSIFGKGLFNICLAIGISMIPSYARVTRGQVLSVKQMDYVTAGTLFGATNAKNSIVHILPNCISPNIVLMTMNLGNAILNEAALSFLGMGINPPTASWGSMVNDGYKYMSSNPTLAIVPGIFIMVVVLCFNMVGDALRDALDPKLRGTFGKLRKQQTFGKLAKAGKN